MLFARGEISTPPMERHLLGEPTAFTHRQSIRLPWCKTWVLTAPAWSHNRSSPRRLCAGFGRPRGSASRPWHGALYASLNLPTCHWRRVNLQEEEWGKRELNRLQCTKPAPEGCAGSKAGECRGTHGQKRTWRGQDLPNGLHGGCKYRG